MTDAPGFEPRAHLPISHPAEFEPPSPSTEKCVVPTVASDPHPSSSFPPALSFYPLFLVVPCIYRLPCPQSPSLVLALSILLNPSIALTLVPPPPPPPAEWVHSHVPVGGKFRAENNSYGKSSYKDLYEITFIFFKDSYKIFRNMICQN